MNKTIPLIYLASQSPRRQALLTQAGISFSVLALQEDDVIEVPRNEEPAHAYVLRMARTKAIMGRRRMRQRHLPSLPVLGADTEVVLDGRIFGKPESAASAKEMLRMLSGRTHEVLTAIALALPQCTTSRIVVSQVTFKALSDDEIMRYLETNEPFGKAGAYAIQGHGTMLITHISGSYTGIVGLPLYETVQILTTQAGLVL